MLKKTHILLTASVPLSDICRILVIEDHSAIEHAVLVLAGEEKLLRSLYSGFPPRKST